METSSNKITVQEQKASTVTEDSKNGDEKTSKFICEIHGEVDCRQFFFRGSWTGKKCSLCQAEKKEAEKTDQAKRDKMQESIRKQASIAKKLNRSCIPKRFLSHSFESYKPANKNAIAIKSKCEEYANNFLEMQELGRCMILCGTTGTGKTHLSCAIANHVIKNHTASALFITAVDAVRYVKETYSKTCKRTEREALSFFTTPDLLIVDEVGVQFGSDAEKMILFEIINKRYEDMLPTMLLSNLAIANLKDFVGDRIIDRMRENGGKYLSFEWESHRKAN